MGITGELVRSVFSKNRSFGTTHDTNVMRNNSVERKRWSSVRSYLCGDEFNSVLAEEDSASIRSSKNSLSSVFVHEDSASVRSSKGTIFSSKLDDDSTSVKGSEATVTQPMLENFNEAQSNGEKDEKTISTSKLDAALVIQSACRSFLARRRNERLGVESIATSIEVQTGNSVVEVISSAQEGDVALTNRSQHNKGARTQSSRLKIQQEDWDDSTVSSNISKMRIQNRLEASTRRERALAYAFSQQLRICSKKKQSSRSGNGSEGDMSWSWLERWMATRQQDNSFGDISKQFEQLNVNQKLRVKKRVLSDLAGEEKESCGSNEVSMHFDSVTISSPTLKKDYYKPMRNRLKTANVSRRKTSPSYHYSKEHSKVSKRDCKGEQGDGNKKENSNEDDVGSHASPHQQ